MGTGHVCNQMLAQMSEGEENVVEKDDEGEAEEREVFRRIEPFRPRVRYDVEVVTKLIVYSGIAWWAVEGCPVIFEMVGLGLGAQRVLAR